MAISDGDKFLYSRRAFGKLALAGLPMTLALRDLGAFAAIDSKFNGVQIGSITYSFRTMPNPEDIIKAYVTIGLGEMELMSGDAEKLAGAPIPMTGRRQAVVAARPERHGPQAPTAPPAPSPGSATASSTPPAATAAPAARPRLRGSAGKAEGAGR